MAKEKDVRVVVYRPSGQNAWYIKVIWGIVVSKVKTAYGSQEEAVAVARKMYPDAEIEVEE